MDETTPDTQSHYRIEYNQHSDVVAYVCCHCGAQGSQVWEGFRPASKHKRDCPYAALAEKEKVEMPKMTPETLRIAYNEVAEGLATPDLEKVRAALVEAHTAMAQAYFAWNIDIQERERLSLHSAQGLVIVLEQRKWIDELERTLQSIVDDQNDGRALTGDTAQQYKNWAAKALAGKEK